jgi:hypothetical protein
LFWFRPAGTSTSHSFCPDRNNPMSSKHRPGQFGAVGADLQSADGVKQESGAPDTISRLSIGGPPERVLTFAG